MRVIFSKIIPTLLALYRPTALALTGQLQCTVNFKWPEDTDMGVWDASAYTDLNVPVTTLAVAS